MVVDLGGDVTRHIQAGFRTLVGRSFGNSLERRQLLTMAKLQASPSGGPFVY